MIVSIDPKPVGNMSATLCVSRLGSRKMYGLLPTLMMSQLVGEASATFRGSFGEVWPTSFDFRKKNRIVENSNITRQPGVLDISGLSSIITRLSTALCALHGGAYLTSGDSSFHLMLLFSFFKKYFFRAQVFLIF